MGTGATYTPKNDDTGKYLIVITVTTPTVRTLIAFDSADALYGNAEDMTLSIGGLVGTDTVTLTSSDNGVSLIENTNFAQRPPSRRITMA